MKDLIFRSEHTLKSTMGKSDIKADVFRTRFANCAFAVQKNADESKNNFVPCLPRSGEDRTQTLDNVTYVVEDTGIRLHGFDNMVRIDPANEDSGWRVRGQTGEAFIGFVLAPVRRVFELYPRVHTFIMAMDKGCFMPRPKTYTQALRTEDIMATMEKRGVVPLETPESGPMPCIIGMSKLLPAWVAVRANRTLYRHAVCEMMDLIIETYRPPPGKRLILDYLDRAATAPDTVDDWMCSERLLCDEFAIEQITAVREQLRTMKGDWRTVGRKVASQLGHAGHIESVPVVLETDRSGVTYAPFLLERAANTCGEADVGIQFWLSAMQADRQHLTLRGPRRSGVPLEPDDDLYTEEQVTAHNAALEREANLEERQPQPLARQMELARTTIAQVEEHLGSIYAQYNASGELQGSDALYKQAQLLALRTTPENPCQLPNRGLVLSSDTDFLSLLPLWYSQFAAECAADGKPPQYCIDNAPLFSVGECNVVRLGWLSSKDDYYIKPPPLKRDANGVPVGPPPPPAQVPILVHEVWDIQKIDAKLALLLDAIDDGEGSDAADTIGPETHLARMASFAALCAQCENDFLAGLYFINNHTMLEAFFAVRGKLVEYTGQPQRRVAVVVPDRYATFVKHCYHIALLKAHPKSPKNKPALPAEQMSYNDVAAVAVNKYSDTQKHMPDRERLKLMYQRLQWWLVYAMRAHISITELLDDTVWGWPEGSTGVKV